MSCAAVVGGTTTALVTAAIPSMADGHIHGCYRNNANFSDARGALRVIDSDANQVCSPQEMSLNWNRQSSAPAYMYVIDAGRTKSITLTADTGEFGSICFDVLGTPKNVSYSGSGIEIKDTSGWPGDSGQNGCGSYPSADLYIDEPRTNFFVTIN